MQRLVLWADAFAAASAGEAFDSRSSGASSLGGYSGGGTGSLIKAHGRSADAEALVHAAAVARTLSVAGGGAAAGLPLRPPLPGGTARVQWGGAAGGAAAAAQLPLPAVVWTPRRLQPVVLQPPSPLQQQPQQAQEKTPPTRPQEALVYTPASPGRAPASRELLFP